MATLGGAALGATGAGAGAGADTGADADTGAGTEAGAGVGAATDAAFWAGGSAWAKEESESAAPITGAKTAARTRSTDAEVRPVNVREENWDITRLRATNMPPRKTGISSEISRSARPVRGQPSGHLTGPRASVRVREWGDSLEQSRGAAAGATTSRARNGPEEVANGASGDVNRVCTHTWIDEKSRSALRRQSSCPESPIYLSIAGSMHRPSKQNGSGEAGHSTYIGEHVEQLSFANELSSALMLGAAAALTGTLGHGLPA